MIVVGAGWAGVAAAKSLISNGINNIRVIEPRDQIGGRSVAATLSDGTRVNIGANWIHGSGRVPEQPELNPVYQALLETQINHIEDKANATVYNTSSKEVKNQEMKSHELLQDLFAKVHDDYFIKFISYMVEVAKEVDPTSLSVSDAIQGFLKESDGAKMNQDERRCFELELRGNATKLAASLEDATVMDVFTAEDFGGPEIFVESFAELIESYASSIPSNSFLMNSAVTKINYGEDDIVTLEYVTEEKKISQVSAKKIILTVPLGVLKANVIQFEPKLPSWKTEAIENMSWGTIDMVVFVWDEDTQLPWDTGTGLQEIRRMDKMSAHLEDQGKWNLFYTYPLPSATRHGMVRQICIGYIAGRDLVELYEKDDEIEYKMGMLNALREMFGEENVPRPAEVIVKSWLKDPYTRGGYSYSQPDENMAAPVDGKIFFAGEATHTEYYQTVHGALLSGMDAVMKLIEEIRQRETNNEFSSEL